MPRQKAKDLSESTFVRLLKTFSRIEKDEFEKFIDSPYFNNQKTLCRVYCEICKYYPDFSGSCFTKEEIFGRLYPDKAYDDIVFRKYLSNLNKLAERYLIQQRFELCTFERNNALLEQFEKRNQRTLFGRQLSVMQAESEKNDKMDIKRFYHLHIQQESVISYMVKNNDLSNLSEAMDKSEHYLLMYVLLNSCQNQVQDFILKYAFSHESAEDKGADDSGYRSMLGTLKNSKQLSDMEKQLALLCGVNIALVNDPLNSSLIEKMKKSLNLISFCMSDELMYIFHSHLNTFYLLAITNGMREFSRGLHESFRMMVEEGLFFYGGKEFVNFTQYREILLNALEVKELEWAEVFIEKYSRTQPVAMRNTVLDYSFALLLYEKGELGEALSRLSVLKRDDPVIKLDTEPLLMMIYYELDYLDLAASSAEGFRKYLSSKAAYSEKIAEKQLNFIKVMKCLIKYKYSDERICDQKDFLRMFPFINSMRQRNWLLAKHAEIRK